MDTQPSDWLQEERIQSELLFVERDVKPPSQCASLLVGQFCRLALGFWSWEVRSVGDVVQ